MHAGAAGLLARRAGPDRPAGERAVGRDRHDLRGRRLRDRRADAGVGVAGLGERGDADEEQAEQERPHRDPVGAALEAVRRPTGRAAAAARGDVGLGRRGEAVDAVDLAADLDRPPAVLDAVRALGEQALVVLVGPGGRAGEGLLERLVPQRGPLRLRERLGPGRDGVVVGRPRVGDLVLERGDRGLVLLLGGAMGEAARRRARRRRLLRVVLTRAQVLHFGPPGGGRIAHGGGLSSFVGLTGLADGLAQKEQRYDSGSESIRPNNGSPAPVNCPGLSGLTRRNVAAGEIPANRSKL